MVRPAQTARSERTREALRQAAVVRFLAQGVEDTSAEQIAADAGVSLRTFYRHFASKHDLLFADYAGLHWFRSALAARSPDEPLIESLHSAIMARPYDDWAVAQTAALRAHELEPGRIVRHMRQVEADFAEAIEEHLTAEKPPKPSTDERMHITVTARCIAAAVFGAMEVWMLGQERSLPELSRLTREALDTVAIGDLARHGRVGCVPVRRDEAVADQPPATDRNEHIPVAPVVVETDLRVDSEVAGDPCLMRCHLGESDVRHVMADDALHARCFGCRIRRCDCAAEQLDDCRTSPHRFAAAKLELAVVAKGFGEVCEPQGVAGPVVAGQGVLMCSRAASSQTSMRER